MRRSFLDPRLLVLLFALPACSSDKVPSPPANANADANSLANLDAVRIWANGSSALGAYLNVYEPIATADGQEGFSDPACPVVSDDGTTLTAMGGCTDSQGSHWVGSAEVTRSGDNDRSLTFDGFG